MEAAARFGKPAMALGVDQVDPQGVESSITRVHDALGRIDVVVANAGYARYGSVLDISARSWERHVAVNLNGTFYVCQSAARVMAKARRGGSIVVTSSSLALVHADDTAAYCTSKSALLALVRSMAAELGVYRIRVNAILPGVVETAMTREMLAGPGIQRDLLQETPIGRLGTPQDIANAAAFLSSEEAGFITGTSLIVDGGQ